ncbi:hypothetical protein SSYIS1_24170 [Serratia symbiotica]|uniref:Uncharacterized protein n=1 Tax=Serratia symbiotica TaxID=138074 RepID=A0A455VHS1_9GAMM|nr:hypothetical protein SSYIS1_24170 [Serratia symbiotica]
MPAATDDDGFSRPGQCNGEQTSFSAIAHQVPVGRDNFQAVSFRISPL